MTSDATPTTPPLRRVVFFGDSRADWWIVPNLPGLQCIPLGTPGATSVYLARQFRTMVAPLQPEIVVIQMGVNDLASLAYYPAKQAEVVAAVCAAIASVVDEARAMGCRVVLTTIFPLAHGPLPDRVVQEAIASVNRELLNLAGPGVQVLDSAAVLCGPDGYVRPEYAEDEAHLSAAGYAALNAALAPLLHVDAP